jgi:hypothetical protein
MTKKSILYFCFAVLTLGGCSKSFLDVNTNPNSAAVSRSDFEFTGAVATTMANMVGPNQIGGAWTGIYGFSTSFTGASQQKNYIFANSDFTYWDAMYQNLNNYKYVIDNSAAEGFGYLAAPAKVMQSYVFQMLVDMYNDVPYTQFGNPAFITPTYDKGQVVYDSLILKLDGAIAEMKAATWPTSIGSDIVFAGNKTSWIQLANTLKLRILLRQAYIPGKDATISAGITTILTEGTGFLNADAYVKPGYLKAAGKLNPLYANLGYNENDVEQQNHQFYKVNNYLITFLKNTNDTFRLQRKADPKTNATIRVDGSTTNTASPIDLNNFNNYVGIDLGAVGSVYATSLTSAIGSSLITKGEATRPMVLMTAAESYFLRAEAAVRYPTLTGLGAAQTLYESGVKAAFVLDAGNGTSSAPTATVAAATAAATAYVARPVNNIGFVASTDKIAAIITQKWVALANFNNFEAWTEWRRTGYPPVPLSISTSSFGVQPRRFYYPISESNTNAANLAAEGTIVPYTSKIFWDKR